MRLQSRTPALVVLLLAAAVVVLHEGAGLLVPVFLSVLLAYTLEPAVAALVRVRCPRFAAALFVYMMLAAAAIESGRVVRAKANQFLDDLPKAIAAIRADLAAAPRDSGPGHLDRLQAAATEVQRTLAPEKKTTGARRVTPVGPAFDVRAYLLPAGLTATVFGVEALIVATLVFLLLVTGDLYKRKLVELAGPRWTDQRVAIAVVSTIDRQIERFLVVRVVISAIVATATGIGVWIVGLEHAAVWGAIAGMLNVLPFVGPSVAVALLTLAAFLQFHALQPTLATAAVAAAIAALEGNLISPWLQSRAGELNTVAVFVSVLFWGWVWGMWGLLLAVPIMVAIKAAADHIEPLQPLGELLGR